MLCRVEGFAEDDDWEACPINLLVHKAPHAVVACIRLYVYAPFRWVHEVELLAVVYGRLEGFPSGFPCRRPFEFPREDVRGRHGV